MKFFQKPSHPLPIVNQDLSQPEVNHWQISEFIIKKIIPIVGWVPYPLPELQLMVTALCLQNPDYVFDWGTHLGISARVFYETARYFNLKTQVITIDLPDDQEHCEHPGKNRGAFLKKIPEVIMLQGDGVTTSLDICKKEKITHALFFLDGDHEYMSVRKELRLIHKSIDNPAMLLHDTFFQSRESGYNIGAYRASTNFISKHSQYNLIRSGLGRPGMDYIFKNEK